MLIFPTPGCSIFRIVSSLTTQSSVTTRLARKPTAIVLGGIIPKTEMERVRACPALLESTKTRSMRTSAFPAQTGRPRRTWAVILAILVNQVFTAQRMETAATLVLLELDKSSIHTVTSSVRIAARELSIQSKELAMQNVFLVWRGITVLQAPMQVFLVS